MNRFIIAAALLAAAWGGASAAPEAAQVGPPGVRSCFWYRGPFSGDPYINIAYPDAGAIYWSAMFTMPEGAKLELKGDFTHARYQSFISYDSDGKPIESLPDYLMEPVAGSTNPFRPGADRTAKARAYSIEVLTAQPQDRSGEGTFQANATRNTIHAPKYTDGQQTLLYRIYVPNAGRDITGGVGLPSPVLTLADGTKLAGADACARLNAAQPTKLGPAALGLPVAQYLELTNQPGKPDTWPATNPPTWYVQGDRESLIAIYTGTFKPGGRRSEGGFYPNPDNNYIRTIVNRRLGHVFVVRGKMPKTPNTLKGDKTMGEGDLRYWSMCSNQSFANTRVNDCVYDEQVPLDKQGMYTIVVSHKADRPRNARPECGIAWLPIADNGDGVADKDVAIVQIRNMLANPSFPHAIQKVTGDAEIAKTMGPYMPKAFYMMPSAVEALFACPLSAK